MVLIKDGDKKHTFLHFACGEVTITLEDVWLQLCVSVEGNAVTIESSHDNWQEICEYLLGKDPIPISYEERKCKINLV